MLTQLSVAAVRGEAFLDRQVTQTKVLTLALEELRGGELAGSIAGLGRVKIRVEAIRRLVF